MAAKLRVPFHPEHALDWAFPCLLIDKMRDLPGVARIRQHGSARLGPAFLAPNPSQHVAEHALIIPPA
jgi:hypothetical protein